jgi:hypothetical protein
MLKSSHMAHNTTERHPHLWLQGGGGQQARNITIVHERIGESKHRWDDKGGKKIDKALKQDGDEKELHTAMMVMPSHKNKNLEPKTQDRKKHQTLDQKTYIPYRQQGSYAAMIPPCRALTQIPRLMHSPDPYTS